MSRHNQVASPNQLAQIKILIDRNDALTRQLLIPWCTVITASLPYLANLMIVPGGIIHDLYIYLLSSLAPHDFAAAPATALQTVDAQSSTLTSHQRLSIELLNTFQEAFLKKLQSLQHLTEVAPKMGMVLQGDAKSWLNMEAQLLETGTLIFSQLERPFQISLDTTESDRLQAKQQFIKSIFFLNAQAKFPVIKDKLQYSTGELIKIGDKFNRNIVLQISPQWLSKNFFELAKILSDSYFNLIDEVNRGELSPIPQLTFIELMMGRDNTSWHLVWVSIVLSFMTNNLVIYPALKRIYRTKDGSREMIGLTTGYISNERAQKVIQLLSRRNQSMEARVSIIYQIFGKALPLLALLLAVYDYRQFERVSPALLVTGLCALGASLYDGYEMVMTRGEKRSFNNKVNRILNHLNGAVQCTGQQWEVEKGRWLSDCYFTYNAQKYGELSAAVVNRTVKDILAENKVTILSFDKRTHNVAPVLFEEDKITQLKRIKNYIPGLAPVKQNKIAEINQQIENYLQRLLAIRQLRQQIQRYFSKYDIYEAQRLGADRLPMAQFTINCSQIADFDIKKFELLFPKCLLDYKKPYLIITGSEAVNGHQLLDQKKCDYQTDTEAREAKDELEVKKQKVTSPLEKLKLKRHDKFGDLSRFYDDETEEKETVIRWSPDLVYRSRQPSAIKPLDHPIYGKSNFVIFNIPENYFPSSRDHKLCKEKVESGRLAKSETGAQGLQFRVGTAVDQTVPGNRTFNYQLRAKLLGSNGKGDVRLFSEPLSTKDSAGNNVTLHNFKCVVAHSHR